MTSTAIKGKETVPWFSVGLVVICLIAGFLSPILVVNQTIPYEQGQLLIYGAMAIQVLACAFGFFHAGKDFPQLFWVFGPVILLSIMLVFTLLPDFVFGA